MCSRNHHGGQENPLIKIQEWTLEDFKNIINQEVLDQIKNIYFCGNFGDPLLNNDLIDMCHYVKTHSEVSIRIHTNGSLRNYNWWQRLAEALPKEHFVIFGIDGLADTHSKYRIGTNYENILNNAGAFIAAGGRAEWAFIVFEHNQHQIDEAKQLAIQMGFERFTTKNSSRFVGETVFPVYDKLGNTIDVLRPPQNTVIRFIDKNTIQNYKQIVEESDIECYALETKEVYIDAYKNLMPCCFLAATPYNYSDPSSLIFDLRQQAQVQYDQIVREIGDINTSKRSIKDIIESLGYQQVWKKYWTQEKSIVCARTCGTNKLSKPMDQFIERESLNG